MSERFTGTGVALVTPMHADGRVREQALREHVERQIGGGVDFLVPCGTTGEAATLSPEEQERVVAIVVDAAQGRSPVMAGAGGNDTARVVELARAATEAGAQAVLTASPAYNKPTPAGLVMHYRTVAEAAGAPLFIYNVPGRTASNVPPAVILELAQVESIAGVKEASGDIEQVMTLLRDAPAGFTVLSGEDSLALPIVALGGGGVISVAANVAPGPVAAMVRAAREGRFDEARELHFALLPLMRANFVETNPIPVKAAMEMLGYGEAHYRLPLVPIERGAREELAEAMRESGILPRGGP